MVVYLSRPSYSWRLDQYTFWVANHLVNFVSPSSTVVDAVGVRLIRMADVNHVIEFPGASSHAAAAVDSGALRAWPGLAPQSRRTGWCLLSS